MESMYKERVRRSISGNVFPPKYPDNKWICTSILNGTNCLAYALNCTYSPRPQCGLYDLELDMSKKMSYTSSKYKDEELVYYFEKWLVENEIEFKRLSSYKNRRPANAYQIVLCNSIRVRDFHFARQNKNGVWSHKMGWWRLPTDICEKDENIEEYMKDFGYKVIAYYAIYKIK